MNYSILQAVEIISQAGITDGNGSWKASATVYGHGF
jgi:hypothetical protein